MRPGRRAAIVGIPAAVLTVVGGIYLFLNRPSAPDSSYYPTPTSQSSDLLPTTGSHTPSFTPEGSRYPGDLGISPSSRLSVIGPNGLLWSSQYWNLGDLMATGLPVLVDEEFTEFTGSDGSSRKARILTVPGYIIANDDGTTRKCDRCLAIDSEDLE